MLELDRISKRNRDSWGRARRDGDSRSRPGAKLKHAATPERKGPDSPVEEAPRYRLCVGHYRTRLADADNLVTGTKSILDGFVDARLLPDDSAKHIASVTHEQHKVGTKAEERMVFVFTRAG